MAGELWLNDDGERILDDDGNLIFCDDCPCGCPTALQIILSGFDANKCDNCMQPSGGFPEHVIITDLEIDGTYEFSGLYASSYGTGPICNYYYAYEGESSDPFFGFNEDFHAVGFYSGDRYDSTVDPHCEQDNFVYTFSGTEHIFTQISFELATGFLTSVSGVFLFEPNSGNFVEPAQIFNDNVMSQNSNSVTISHSCDGSWASAGGTVTVNPI